MRLKSGIWVAAYVRRCHIEGAFAAVRRRGAEEAGAVYHQDQPSRRHRARSMARRRRRCSTTRSRSDRLFTIVLGRDGPVPEADIEARLTREIGFDPDIWIVEVEDRDGRAFLDDAVV